ncbi:hypothetical protein Vretimale_3187, partial [Volvox reticuliferus]
CKVNRSSAALAARTLACWAALQQFNMARALMGLLLAALLAGVCCINQRAAAQPTAAVLGYQVNVTVIVEGTVQVYVSNTLPQNDTSSSRTNSAKTLAEYTYALVDTSAGLNPPVELRVDFGARSNSLKTGDVVQTSLTLQLTPDQAKQLGIGGLNDASSGGQRRLLSEAHERARRMVLDFHETRRSLQEFMSLQNILNILNRESSDAPKAENPVIVGKNTAKDLFVLAAGAQQNVSSLTFVFRSSACGLIPNLTAEVVRQWWYDNGDNARITATMERYHKTCTYDQLTFRPEKNLVMDVDIPCVGNTSYGPYDLRLGRANGKNDENEKYALTELAWMHLQRTNPSLYSQWSTFRRKIMIFPFNWYKPVVTWTGLAALGCTEKSDCYSWINSGFKNNSFIDNTIVIRNLGHNIGLMPSGMRSCYTLDDNITRCDTMPYTDPTDGMGRPVPMDIWRTIVCNNAPQSYKAGWAEPMPGGHIRVIDMLPGAPRTFMIPPMSATSKNMIRIIIDTVNVWKDSHSSEPQRALFVSYREGTNGSATYDSGLPLFLNFVWVHEYNDTANGAPASSMPAIVGILASNRTNWRTSSFTQQLTPAALGGIVIAVRSTTPQFASVSLCRYLRTSESAAGSASSCSDGLDNDCFRHLQAQQQQEHHLNRCHHRGFLQFRRRHQRWRLLLRRHHLCASYPTPRLLCRGRRYHFLRLRRPLSLHPHDPCCPRHRQPDNRHHKHPDHCCNRPRRPHRCHHAHHHHRLLLPHRRPHRHHPAFHRSR